MRDIISSARNLATWFSDDSSTNAGLTFVARIATRLESVSSETTPDLNHVGERSKSGPSKKFSVSSVCSSRKRPLLDTEIFQGLRRSVQAWTFGNYST